MEKSKKVRIGSGAGYGGDRIEPAIDLLKQADLDYIIFECLAERTIALANQEKLIDSNKGYNPMSITRFNAIFDAYESNPFKTKIITNMGAANPLALARVVKQMLIDRNINLKVAAILGDDVLNNIDFNTHTIETNEMLEIYKNQMISANAYTGIHGIVQALESGADIIIGGRIADPSLTLAPLVYEFNWKMDDYDRLARGTCAGHLLECAAQVCGGYFHDGYKKFVPNIEQLGFPFADINENGEIFIQKLSTAGGVINSMTVKEQLLYEIMDPSNYYTPDVIMDISHATVTEIDKDIVQISNIYGKMPNGKYKVSVGYTDGYMAESEISYGGHHAVSRANTSIEILKYRLIGKFDSSKIQYDLIGINSLFKTNEPQNNDLVNEVRLRVASKSKNIEDVQTVSFEVESLYTNGPAGGGGVRSSIQSIVSIVSILIDRNLIKEEIIIL